MVATLAEACVTPPSDDVGAPTGYGDWRWGIQILLPGDPSSLWGVGLWGTSKWSVYQWYDITDYVRGCEWVRGASEFDGRPDVGVATITLDNHDYRFSPVDPSASFNGTVLGTADSIINAYFAPGALMRIVAHSPTLYGPGGAGGSDVGWLAQFTGVVESWNETRTDLDKESYVTVTVVETLSRLARVNEFALSSAVGNGDDGGTRFERLGDAAGWQYGYDLGDFSAYNEEAATWYDLQSTVMADNRLAELYLTADSLGGVVRSGRDGRMQAYGGAYRFWNGSAYVTTAFDAPTTIHGPILITRCYACALPGASADDAVYVDPEGLTWENDDSPILNFVQMARVGGTEQTASSQLSISQNGRLTFGRNDLINKSNALTQSLADVLVARRARSGLRVASVRLDSLADPRAVAALVTADIHFSIFVHQATRNGGEIEVFSRVDGMEHQVTPTSLGGPVNWTCTYTLGRVYEIIYTPPS